MNYLEELKEINKISFKIADYKKCRTLGHGAYYEWIPLLIIYAVMVLFFNLIAVINSTSEDILEGLKVMNFISLAMGLIYIPLIIMCLVRNAKQKNLILNGYVSLGMVTECKYSHRVKNGVFYSLTYCYLNCGGRVEEKQIKSRVELNQGKKIFVAHNNSNSIILSEVLLQNERELFGLNDELEFSNLTGCTVDGRIMESDVYNLKKTINKKDRGSGYFERFTLRAVIANAKIITSHIYRIKTARVVYYCFIDLNGERHINKQPRILSKPLPKNVYVAYNPTNPQEAFLISNETNAAIIDF